MFFDLEKYPRGRRGSPAKGVVRVERSSGSNPDFSAIKETPIRRLFFFFSYSESYRSGHNGAVLKTVRGQPHAGSNPALSAKIPASPYVGAGILTVQDSKGPSKQTCRVHVCRPVAFPQKSESCTLRQKEDTREGVLFLAEAGRRHAH